MSVNEFLKFGVVGVISAVLVTRLEPFKSDFPLAVLAGAAVGVISAMVEMATRSIAKRLNSSDKRAGGPR